MLSRVVGWLANLAQPSNQRQHNSVDMSFACAVATKFTKAPFYARSENVLRHWDLWRWGWMGRKIAFRLPTIIHWRFFFSFLAGRLWLSTPLRPISQPLARWHQCVRNVFLIGPSWRRRQFHDNIFRFRVPKARINSKCFYTMMTFSFEEISEKKISRERPSVGSLL